MLITDWEARNLGASVEVSASMDGFRLWYISKSFAVSRGGDPFVAAALLPAMLKGEPLQVDPALPVSPKLLQNLGRLQKFITAESRSRSSPSRPRAERPSRSTRE